MTDQPKALRLADALDAVNTNNADSLLVQMAARSAAAELRRLHAENEDFRATIDYLTRENAEQIGEIVALKERGDELLAVLRMARWCVQADLDSLVETCRHQDGSMEAADAALVATYAEKLGIIDKAIENGGAA